jgi:hypothetical protein
VGIDLDELWEGKEILKSFFKFIAFDNHLEETLKQSIMEANTLMKK